VYDESGKRVMVVVEKNVTHRFVFYDGGSCIHNQLIQREDGNYIGRATKTKLFYESVMRK